LLNFKHVFIVNSPVEKVWDFYTDIKHLEIITPKKLNLRIVSATSQKLTQGSEIWIESRLAMMFRERWHSIITSSCSDQYEYVDEMLSGPFKKWRHLHRFSDVTNNDNNKSQRQKTEVVDEINF
jgi:ligand-binding SRPBCC domain-containing protein